MKILRDERGTMMIEATLCMIASLIVIVMVMCFGFVVYQKAMMGIVANQVAEEIAVTYKLRNVADSSSVTEADVYGVDKYRYFKYSDDFNSDNETKLSLLAQQRLTKTSLAIDDGGYNVEVDRVPDDIGRAHYVITVTNKYTYLFEGVFSIFDMDVSKTLSATSYVNDTDILSYVNTKHTSDYVISKIPGEDTLTSIISFIKTVIEIFS